MPARFHYVLFISLLCTVDFLCAYSSKSGYNEKKSHNSTSKYQTAKKNDFFRLNAGMKLIFIILVVIFIGISIYYFFIFYPILCKKEGSYDVVQHSRDITPSPNTENLPNA